jgi:hypothetical protein
VAANENFSGYNVKNIKYFATPPINIIERDTGKLVTLFSNRGRLSPK